MNSTTYERIGSVYFQKGNEGSGFNYVEEFEDDDDQLIIRSPFQIDFVYRGWIGDITYWASHGIDTKDMGKMDLTSEPHYVRDVLCVRVNVTCNRGEPVMWKYVFLKY